jgi:hypothetical protein
MKNHDDVQYFSSEGPVTIAHPVASRDRNQISVEWTKSTSAELENLVNYKTKAGTSQEPALQLHM